MTHLDMTGGDEYIRQAGMCLEEGTPKGTLCAHISGDEFNILFYGYESQNAIRKEISKLKEKFFQDHSSSERTGIPLKYLRRNCMVSGGQ